MKKIVWSILLIPFLPALALAGVVLTDISGDRTYISDGRMKFVSQDGQSQVFLPEKGEIILIDDNRRIYARGTVNDFCRTGKDLMDSVMAGMSPEEREMMRQFMGASQGAPSPRPAVSIASQGSGGKIAGLETTKYRVDVDGAPYAELWLSSDRVLERELGGLQKLLALTAEMSACMEDAMGMNLSANPENTPEYQALYKEGYPLKVVSLQAGGANIDEEIVKVETKSMPSDAFSVPAQYRSVPFAEFVGGDF